MIPSDAAGGYTVFGTITDGLAILEGIGAGGTSDGKSDGPPAEPVIINEVSVE
jgi:peptidyl-prolyl cis-trans isomerase B (cyclophilin B)